MPGDGCVNYPPLMRLLTEQAYHGWLVVETEQDPAVAHPLTYARLGDNNLNRLARDAGVTCHICCHAAGCRMLKGVRSPSHRNVQAGNMLPLRCMNWIRDSS